jgi:hypothetical protein
MHHGQWVEKLRHAMLEDLPRIEHVDFLIVVYFDKGKAYLVAVLLTQLLGLLLQIQ